MVENAIVIFGTLSGAVTGIVTFVKSLLLQWRWFAALEAQQQAIGLQLVAFVAGLGLAFSAQANIIAQFPAFASVSAPVGTAITGLICSGGSQLFFAALTFLAGRPIPVPTPQLVETPHEKNYVPFS